MGEFRSPLDSTEFDLYVLGRPPRFKHLEPVATGFSGLAVSLSEARALVEQRRQDGIGVAVAQEQGMIPGVKRIYVDKVLARALDDEEYVWVSRLTYG
jgi:hypothetical protein